MTLPDLTALLRTLTGADIEFVVVGGVAVAAHDYVRATEDLDLVPAPGADNLDRLANLLIELEARHVLNPERPIGDVERRALHQGRNLSVSTSVGDLDIIQRLPGVPSYADLRAEAMRVTLDDFELVVCSREHLVSMKRARGSAIDIADLERLTDGR